MVKNWLYVKQLTEDQCKCENEALPDGFTLQIMDMWWWSEIVECTQLLVFDQ